MITRGSSRNTVGTTLETRTSRAGATYVALAGVINERFDADLFAAETGPTLIVDLHGVTSITSFGVREWTQLVRSLPAAIAHLYLLRCPPCFVYQLNSVANFAGRAEVISANEIVLCDDCGAEWTLLVNVLGERERVLRGAVAAPSCPTCGRAAEFEVNPARYFRFAVANGAQSLEPAAACLLAELGVYHAAAPAGVPATGVKLVHGEVTLIALTGTLDGRFRPRTLTDGVEGHVVLDLEGLAGLAAGGSDRWRAFLEALGNAASVTVAGLPEALLAAGLPLPGLHVASVRRSFICSACGQGNASESASTACDRCGSATAATTGETELVGALARAGAAPDPAPAIVTEVIARRADLLSRAGAEGGEAAQGLDRYRVIRLLGEGGMARVLLAVRQGMGGFEKPIALKKVRRELVERKAIAVDRFLDEARIAASLTHPNIAQVFEVGMVEGDLFIAMEYVHGVDALRLVRESLRRGQRLPPSHVLFIGAKVASALDHAHHARDLAGQPLAIVHCDVSPSNVVVSFDGQVKLVNFGIARAANVQPREGGSWGKASYMSPEHVRGEPLDGRTDVFSLGVVLHELLAGRSLFGGKGKDAVAATPVPPLTELGLPPFVDELVMRSLERDRDRRYPDARMFQVALERAADRLGPPCDAHVLATYLRSLFGDDEVRAPIVGERTPHGA